MSNITQPNIDNNIIVFTPSCLRDVEEILHKLYETQMAIKDTIQELKKEIKLNKLKDKDK